MGFMLSIGALVGLNGLLSVYHHVSGFSELRMPEIQGLSLLGEVQQTVSAAEQSLLIPGYFSDETEKLQFLKNLEETWKRADKGWESSESLNRTSEGRKFLNALKVSWDRWENGHAAVVKLSEEGKRLEALALSSGRVHDALATSETNLRDLLDYSLKLGEEARKNGLKTVWWQQRIALAGTVLGLAAAVAFGLFFSRSISEFIRRVIGALKEMTDQFSASSDQIAASSNQLAEDSSRQMAALEETSSVTEELALDNRSHNDFLQELKKVTDNAETVRKDTLKNINEAVTAMSEIEKSSIETSDTVKIIEGISFQTNLLALNASVEAARAGEVGAGFAVVAEEVRNLAIHSAEAASNTSNLIKKMVQAVADGGKLVSSCTTEFENYSVAADRYVEVINKASEASREQDQGFEQINFAIRDISKVDQKNAAGAEEVAVAAKEMHHQTQVMNRCISELLELLYGSGANGETASKIQEVLKAVSKPSMGSSTYTGHGGQRERSVKGGINV